MTAKTNITRGAPSATPSPFSLQGFNELLLHMERTIVFDDELKHMPHHDPVEIDRAGEEVAAAWTATETAAFNFLRAHEGRTAVPLLVETARTVVALLDIETDERTSLSETMEAALARRAAAPRGTDVRVLLDRAVPLLFGIASMQAALFERRTDMAAA